MYSQRLLQTLLDYDAKTGQLRWRERPRDFCTSEAEWKRWNKRFAGSETFVSSPDGYRIVSLFGKLEKAHRVAYCHFYGVWPTWPSEQIDHINGDRSDNRISNLRLVSAAINRRNMCVSSRNTTGRVGICRVDSGKWEATIRVDGRLFHLGRFLEFEQAVSARKLAERRFDFHPNHGRMA